MLNNYKYLPNFGLKITFSEFSELIVVPGLRSFLYNLNHCRQTTTETASIVMQIKHLFFSLWVFQDMITLTRLGNLLDFRQLFKAFGNN